MSIFATVAVVCTMSACNDYYLDTAQNKYEANDNQIAIQKEFLSIWEDEKGLTHWLEKYKIGETIFEIQTLEFETQEIQDEDLP